MKIKLLIIYFFPESTLLNYIKYNGEGKTIQMSQEINEEYLIRKNLIFFSNVFVYCVTYSQYWSAVRGIISHILVQEK